jgi:hypothetical protein
MKRIAIALLALMFVASDSAHAHPGRSAAGAALTQRGRNFSAARVMPAVGIKSRFLSRVVGIDNQRTAVQRSQGTLRWWRRVLREILVHLSLLSAV